MNIPISISSLNPEAPFKKHSATIHIEGQLSLVDHKILNILYKCAYERDNCTSDYYYVKVSDIVNFLGWQKRVKKDIDEALNQLRVSGIRYNIFNQDRKNEIDWDQAGGTGFIASYLYDDTNNFVRFSLSPEIRNMLQKPNIYAYIDLRVQKKLKSRFEIIYYEYFIEELFRNGSSDMTTRWYTVNDIRRMLNISPDQFKDFKFFNRDCIKEPLKSINASETGLFAEVANVEKVNRKVVAMNFHIKLTNVGDMGGHQETLSLNTEDEVIQDIRYDITKELFDLFQSEKTCNQIIHEVSKKYPDCDLNLFIINNIEYAKKKKDIGTVTNFLGYLRSAIMNDYAKYIDRSEKIRVEEKEKNDLMIKKAMQDKIAEESRKRNELQFESLNDQDKAYIYKKCSEEAYNFNNCNEENKKLIAIEYFIRNKDHISNMVKGK